MSTIANTPNTQVTQSIQQMQAIAKEGGDLKQLKGITEHLVSWINKAGVVTQSDLLTQTKSAVKSIFQAKQAMNGSESEKKETTELEQSINNVLDKLDQQVKLRARTEAKKTVATDINEAGLHFKTANALADHLEQVAGSNSNLKAAKKDIGKAEKASDVVKQKALLTGFVQETLQAGVKGPQEFMAKAKEFFTANAKEFDAGTLKIFASQIKMDIAEQETSAQIRENRNVFAGHFLKDDSILTELKKVKAENIPKLAAAANLADREAVNQLLDEYNGKLNEFVKPQASEFTQEELELMPELAEMETKQIADDLNGQRAALDQEFSIKVKSLNKNQQAYLKQITKNEKVKSKDELMSSVTDLVTKLSGKIPSMIAPVLIGGLTGSMLFGGPVIGVVLSLIMTVLGELDGSSSKAQNNDIDSEFPELAELERELEAGIDTAASQEQNAGINLEKANA